MPLEKWDPKDPSDELDYEIDWSLALAAGETIVTSTWSSTPTGTSPALVLEDAQIVSAKTQVWISGGKARTLYLVTNTIVTSASRTFERSVELKVWNL